MSISEELARLQALHESGALTESEFTEAKAKVLADETTSPPEASDSALHRDVQQLKIQNELLRLDQDWEIERQDYMIRGRYGSRSVPTEGGSIGGAIVISLVGLFLLGLTARIPHAGALPFMGFLFIVIGIGAGISGYTKAQTYNAALYRYEQRRSKLQAQLDRQ